MLARLKRFERARALGAAEALALLRPLFLLGFGAQLALAAATGALAYLLLPRGAANPLLAPVLVALAVAQLPLALTLGVAAARPETRRAALGATLLSATLLAVPAWFLALAAALEAGALYLALLAALLALDYVLGMLLCARFARRAAAAPVPEAEDQAEVGAVSAER